MTIRNVLPLKPGQDYVAEVAANVRGAAGRAGLNQSQIARQLGWASATVSLRWYGQRPWSLSDLAQLAPIVGTTPWELARPANAGRASLRARRDSNPQPSDLESTVHGSLLMVDFIARRVVAA